MTNFVRLSDTGPKLAARRGRAGLGRAAELVVGGVILVFLASCTASTPRDSDRAVPIGDANPTATGSATATGTDLIPPDSGSGSATAETKPGGAGAEIGGPPAAAVLTWLDGPVTKEGVVTGKPPLQQWVGRDAGEYATIGDGWYRYFGPDGSLVGCTSAGACVGVGSDGTVAVTKAPRAPREVYLADGSYLGEYSADGDKLGAASDPAAFASALKGTGVDLAGLVNAASRGTPFAGGVTGDPHLITMGGERYTTQATGQLIARTGDKLHEIELQFSAMAYRDDVSIVSMLGISTGSGSIVLNDAGTLTINGENPVHESGFVQITLPDGVAVGRWPADSSNTVAIAVVWPNGGTVVAQANHALGITVIAHLPPLSTATGLFGSASVPSGPDLVTPNGTSVAAAGGITATVSAWRVHDSGKLLPAAAAPSVGSGSKPPTVDPAARKIAERLCSAGGISGSQDLASCAFDIAVTGDTGFIPGHVALAVAAQSDNVPQSFARRWPALVAAPAAAATNLPEGGSVHISLAAGGAQLYRLTTREAGQVRVANSAVCDTADGTSSEPGLDQPGWRLFDITGRPMSDRMGLCGSSATGAVPAGDYLLAVANGVGTRPLVVNADVTLP